MTQIPEKPNAAQAVASQAKAADRKLAGLLFVSGSILFLLLTTASEAIYPNFSLQTNALSDMAALGSSTTVIEETALLELAFCWILGAYYLFRNTGRNRLMILNLLPGAGFLLAGVFPENVSIIGHSLGAMLVFPFGPLTVILSSKITRSPLRYLSVALGLFSAASTVILFFGWKIICGTCGYVQGLSSALLGLGGWESMSLYSLMIWLIGFGSYLLALNGDSRN